MLAIAEIECSLEVKNCKKVLASGAERVLVCCQVFI